MENEILFRGKCIDSGEWVYGYYVKHDAVKVCFSSDDPKTRHYIVRDVFVIGDLSHLLNMLRLTQKQFVVALVSKTKMANLFLNMIL